MKTLTLIGLICLSFHSYSQQLLGKDTLVCSGQFLELNTPDGNSPFKWSTGEESNKIRVYQSGTYWLEQNGVRDSIRLTIYDEEYNQASYWALGQGAALKFDTTRPEHKASVVDLPNNNYSLPAGTSTAVDNDGDLLFFTDGKTLYDSTGKSLETGFAGDPNLSQNSVIVPQPGSQVNYYLFTIENNPLSYSTIKINKDRSLTTVSKNSPLAAGVDGKITAVKMGNDLGVWVMTHEENSNVFKAYPVTSGGIGKPVESIVGTPTYTSSGYMKFSSGGNRLALAADFTEVFYFDSNTGKVQVPKHLFISSSYGLEFSPDGGYLFVSTYDSTQTDSAGVVTPGGSLLKVNIGWGFQPEIVYEGDASTRFGALQLAPDGNIYVVKGNSKSQCLGAITKPDDWQVESGYEPDKICFNKDVTLGLPNFPQHYFYKGNNFALGVSFPCEGDSVDVGITSRLAELPYAKFSVLVNFGHPESGSENYTTALKSQHFYPVSPDPYIIKVTTTDVCRVNQHEGRTFITPQPTINISDTLLCPGALLPSYDGGFYAPAVYPTYLWTLGEDTVGIEQRFQPLKEGNYKVHIVVGGKCDTTDYYNIAYRTPPPLDLGEQKNACQGDTVLISADVGIPSATYVWSTTENTDKIYVQQPGIYKVTLKDHGCVYNDSVSVLFHPQPENPRLKTDTIGCFGEKIVFDAKNPSGYFFKWNTGATTAAITTDTAGIYIVDISNVGCKRTYQTNLKYHDPIIFSLEKVYSICENDSEKLTLSAGVGTAFKWVPDMDTTASKMIVKAGEYSVQKTNPETGCIGKYEFSIRNLCEPRVFLPEIFTPNLDEINDRFIPGVANIVDYEMLIYNRWGELVFASNTKDSGWDGTYKGEDSPVDNYICIINYSGESLQGKTRFSKKGSFLLAR